MAAAQQDAVAGQIGGRRGQRGRRCQRECARAGGHQHGQRDPECLFRLVEVPEGPDRRGNDKQHQNKVARQLIRHLGDGRFVIEGMILQAHDLGDARLFDAVGHPDL